MKQFSDQLTRQLEELAAISDTLRASESTRALSARLDHIELAIVDVVIEMEGRAHRMQAEASTEHARELSDAQEEHARELSDAQEEHARELSDALEVVLPTKRKALLPARQAKSGRKVAADGMQTPTYTA